MLRSEALSTLGLNEGFDKKDLKKAWRAFSSKNHPDKGGDKDVFQKGQAAKEILEGKREPDDMLNGSRSGGFNPFRHSRHGFSQDEINKMFNSGETIQITLTNLDIFEIQEGCEKEIDFSEVPQVVCNKINLKIPKGFPYAGSLKLSGKGGVPKGEGGSPGDMIVRIVPNTLSSLRYFESYNGPYDGYPRPLLHQMHRVTSFDVLLGTKYEIPTLDGNVLITTPASIGRMQNGAGKMRLLNKGMMSPDGTRDPLIVVFHIVQPDRTLSDDEKESLAKLNDSLFKNNKDLESHNNELLKIKDK